MVNAQEWLDYYYPKDGVCQRKKQGDNHEDFGKTREQITELDISNKGLAGSLNLTDFVNLTKLECYNNELTELDLTGMTKLERIRCDDKYLTNFDYSALNTEKLTCLNIHNNNLSTQDFSVFSRFSNLKGLWIGNNDKKKNQPKYLQSFHGQSRTIKKFN